MRYGSVQNAEIHLFCIEYRDFLQKKSCELPYPPTSNAFLVESIILFALSMQFVAPHCTPLQTWRDIFIEDVKA